MTKKTCFKNGCCGNCPKLGPNCVTECCKVPSPVTCQGTIQDAVCTAVLTDKILNCITINSNVPLFRPDVVFAIDTPPSTVTYTVGDPICIKEIGISYGAIGFPALDIPTVYVNSDLVAIAPQGAGVSCPTTPTATALYNDFTGSISTPKCCKGDETLGGAITRIIETDVTFYICNLEIVVRGLIGCVPFTARSIGSTTASPPVTSPLQPFSALGFTTLTFSGDMCLPTGLQNATLNETFDPCLNVKCIRTSSVYTAPVDPAPLAQFKASVEYGFSVNKNIYVTSKEPIAVFTSPNPQFQCTDGNVPTNICNENCPDL